MDIVCKIFYAYLCNAGGWLCDPLRQNINKLKIKYMRLKTGSLGGQSEAVILKLAMRWLFKHLNMTMALFRSKAVLPVQEAETLFGRGMDCLPPIIPFPASRNTDPPVG